MREKGEAERECEKTGGGEESEQDRWEVAARMCEREKEWQKQKKEGEGKWQKNRGKGRVSIPFQLWSCLPLGMELGGEKTAHLCPTGK